MKRFGVILVFCFLSVLLSSTSKAAESNSIPWPGVTGYPKTYPPAVILSGKPGDNGGKATLTDTAQTLQTIVEGAGKTWQFSSLNPIGALVQAETYAMRCQAGGTVPTVDNVGVVIAAGGSWHLTNPNYVTSFRCVNKVAGSNAIIHWILEY